jgi:RNA polymerase sigma-70 factor (ECF subfamily)
MNTRPLLRHLRGRLRHLLRRQGCTHDDADDLIQEAFLRLQVYYEEGGEVHEPEAFLVRTALRLSMNARRDERRRQYVDAPVESLQLVDTRPSPEDVLAAQQRLRQMKRALDALGPAMRDIFFLSRVDGLSYAQIAKLQGLTAKAVERRVARAMLALSLEGKTE